MCRKFFLDFVFKTRQCTDTNKLAGEAGRYLVDPGHEPRILSMGKQKKPLKLYREKASLLREGTRFHFYGEK